MAALFAALWTLLSHTGPVLAALYVFGLVLLATALVVSGLSSLL